jgi:hypothetical protein
MECFQNELAYLDSDVSYESKMFMKPTTPGANVIKLFTAVIYDFCNKLECLSLASLSSLV